MAAKKFYAVKKGKKTGVFSTWDDCKAAVDGYSGAEYKGFATLLEAQQYLGISKQSADGEVEKVFSGKHKNTPTKDRLVVYVDGSYEDSIKKYAFGCVFLLEDGSIYTECGNGDNPESLQHRNVTGEMLGAMYAVKTALMNGFSEVEICFDYQGIEKWVTGEWRAKNNLTQTYAAAMRDWSKSIHISFTKVAAHTNVKYNELADQMAKKGLQDANGVPKVRKITELNRYIEG